MAAFAVRAGHLNDALFAGVVAAVRDEDALTPLCFRNLDGHELLQQVASSGGDDNHADGIEIECGGRRIRKRKKKRMSRKKKKKIE